MKRYSGFLAIVFILLTPLALLSFDVSTHSDWFNTLQAFTGFKAIIIFSAFFIFCNLFFIPLGLPLNLLAGALWGTFLGGLLINCLATLVAVLAFLIARNFSAVFVGRNFFCSRTLIRTASAIRRYDWQFITMMRINPIVPFCVSNYAFGLIPRLSFKTYIVATAFANLLPCYAFASIGAAYKTFTIDNHNIPNIIFAISVVLLLVSLLFVIKIFCQQGDPHNERSQN